MPPGTLRRAVSRVFEKKEKPTQEDDLPVPTASTVEHIRARDEEKPKRQSRWKLQGKTKEQKETTKPKDETTAVVRTKSTQKAKNQEQQKPKELRKPNINVVGLDYKVPADLDEGTPPMSRRPPSSVCPPSAGDQSRMFIRTSSLHSIRPRSAASYRSLSPKSHPATRSRLHDSASSNTSPPTSPSCNTPASTKSHVPSSLQTNRPISPKAQSPTSPKSPKSPKTHLGPSAKSHAPQFNPPPFLSPVHELGEPTFGTIVASSTELSSEKKKECPPQHHQLVLSLEERFLAVRTVPNVVLNHNAERVARIQRFLQNRLATDYQVKPIPIENVAEDAFFLLIVHYNFSLQGWRILSPCSTCRTTMRTVKKWLEEQASPAYQNEDLNFAADLSRGWLHFGNMRISQTPERTYKDSVVEYQASTGHFGILARKLCRDRKRAKWICGETLGMWVVNGIEEVTEKYFVKLESHKAFELTKNAARKGAAALARPRDEAGDRWNFLCSSVVWKGIAADYYTSISNEKERATAEDSRTLTGEETVSLKNTRVDSKMATDFIPIWPDSKGKEVEGRNDSETLGAHFGLSMTGALAAKRRTGEYGQSTRESMVEGI